MFGRGGAGHHSGPGLECKVTRGESMRRESPVEPVVEAVRLGPGDVCGAVREFRVRAMAPRSVVRGGSVPRSPAGGHRFAQQAGNALLVIERALSDHRRRPHLGGW